MMNLQAATLMAENILRSLHQPGLPAPGSMAWNDTRDEVVRRIVALANTPEAQARLAEIEATGHIPVVRAKLTPEAREAAAGLLRQTERRLKKDLIDAAARAACHGS